MPKPTLRFTRPTLARATPRAIRRSSVPTTAGAGTAAGRPARPQNFGVNMTRHRARAQSSRGMRIPSTARVHLGRVGARSCSRPRAPDPSARHVRGAFRRAAANAHRFVNRSRKTPCCWWPASRTHSTRSPIRHRQPRHGRRRRQVRPYRQDGTRTEVLRCQGGPGGPRSEDTKPLFTALAALARCRGLFCPLPSPSAGSVCTTMLTSIAPHRTAKLE